MKKIGKPTVTLISLATAALFSNTAAQAALVVPAGNSQVVNDTDLNITWTQDANLFKTQADSYAGGAAAFVTAVINSVGGKIYDTPNAYDTPANSGYHILAASDFNTSTGTMDWWGAQAWVSYLNSTSYAGQTGWRQPTSNAVAGYDSGSELGHLFYTELGGTAGSSIVTTHANAANYNLFSNVQSNAYWFGLEYAPYPFLAWLFSTGLSPQLSYGLKNLQFYGWAVRPGQVAAVPVPAAVWLMGSAVAGLLGAVRRRAGTLAIG